MRAKMTQTWPVRHLQRGATLIVAVVLLLLLSVIVLLATNVGLQEQRASGNDLRAKMAHHAAEAGLNFGGEFVKQNVGMLRNPDLWTLCTNASFPCGVFPNAAAANLQMFTGNFVLPAPIAAGNLVIGTPGGFTADVQVGAVICRLDSGAPCATNLAADGSSVVSIVSRARIGGEGASTTLVQSITSFSKLNTNTGVPPIAASGTVAVGGSLDLVTNPNAGGIGVPVSVWTRKDVSGNGTPNTCYLDEFIRFGSGGGSATPRFCTEAAEGCTGDNADVIVCDGCSCAKDHSISYNPPGGGGICDGEGIDILDIDNNACGDNFDVLPEEFPCDMFEFIFGVQARTDEDGDFFCEKLITTTDSDGNTVGVDELWLRQNANIIITDPVDTNNPKHRTCDFLTDAASARNATGLIWDRIGCRTGQQVGTVDEPVVLVVDGDAHYNAGFRLFGILFVRATGAADLVEADGGNATLTFNGHGAIYGAAVVQGTIDNLTGTAAFIHNERVLSNLINLPEIQAFGTMPGSWTDRFSY